MTTTWVRSQTLAQIERLCREPLDASTLRGRLLATLRQAVGFDAYVWLLTDPVTCVGAAPLADVPCLPELPELIRSKYLTAVNRWTTLSTSDSRVGLLHREVDGRLERSRLWRDVLNRYGIADLASIAFADQFGCWGFLDLWRTGESEPFGSADAEFLAMITPAITTALRESQARTFLDVPTPHRNVIGPVVLTLNDNLQITSRTAASADWLDTLLPPRPGDSAIPASVYNVAAQLLAVEAGIDDHDALARTHLTDGFWLALRAARLTVPDRRPAPDDIPTDIVVTMEEATAAERLEIYCLATGLTPREQNVVELIATGADTRAMAHAMRVAEHTIQDHLKSIFTKSGVRDRISLLSRALGTHPSSPELRMPRAVDRPRDCGAPMPGGSL